MAILGTINLIQSKTSDNPELDKLIPVLKKVSYILVITLVVSGIIVGGLFSYLQIRETQLKSRQGTLLATITQDAAKEGFLTAIRERIVVLDKIMTNQKHVSVLFPLVADIVPAGSLTSMSYDDAGKMTIVAVIGSIPEAIEIVDKTLSLGREGKLTKAALVSFGISVEKGMEISLTFVPVL